MLFVKNFVLLIIFLGLIVSFALNKENNNNESQQISVLKKEVKTSINKSESDNNPFVKKNESIPQEETEENPSESNNDLNEDYNIKEKNKNIQIINSRLKQGEISRAFFDKIANSATDEAMKSFSKEMTKKANFFSSIHKPSEEFINIVESYQGEFVPLDTLPDTESLCFDSNYQAYSFGIITIVNNNGIKEVYECVYSSENTGKWKYRGLANN